MWTLLEVGKRPNPLPRGPVRPNNSSLSAKNLELRPFYN